MRKAEPDDVETRLVRTLALEIARLGIAVDGARVASAVRAVLADPALAAEEEERLLAGGSLDPVADVLALRVERAMRAGLEAADATVARGSQGTAVLFLRDGEDAATPADTVTATLAAKRDPESLERPVLVLAQPSAFETLQHDAGTLRTLTPELSFDDETERKGDAAKDGPAVLRVDERFLAEVHARAREFVREHGIEAEPADAMIGKTFANKYELERCIGRGGFGSVYIAREKLLGNRVAIKVLTPRKAVTEEQKRDFRAQLEEFRQEARRVVSLRHPNIVDWKVFDQTEDGTYYFVMELLEGEELEDLLKREGRLEPMRVANILLQVLSALRAAHHLSETVSILHLDLKPKNVFHLKKRQADEPDRIKVIDFGIGQFIGGSEKDGDRPEARAVVPDAGKATGSTGSTGGTVSTEDWHPTGTVKSIVHRSTACTPEYASPEQCTHMLAESELAELGVVFTRLDGRSDIYSLGVMGFQLLTGQLPFERPKDRREFLRLHVAGTPRKAGSMGIKLPRKLARFVDQCLAKDRDARFADTNEAYAALERVVNPFKWKALAAVAAVALAVTTGVVAWAVSRQESRRFTAPAELGLDGIYCGVERPEVVVDASGLPEELVGRPARLVGNANKPDASVLAWTVDWRGEDLVVRPPAGVTDFDGEAFLEIRPPGGEAQYSNESFRVRYLGEGAVAVTSLGVRGLDLMDLDPRGQKLSIEVAGRTDDIAKVVLVGPRQDAHSPRQSTASTETDPRYELDLGELELENGEAELSVTVTDKAGRELTKSVRLPIAADPLGFDEEARLDKVSLYSGRYSIGRASAPELAFTLNRKANVRWWVKRSNGDEIAAKGGIAKGVVSGPIPLDLSGEGDYDGWIEVSADDGEYVLHAQSDRAKAAGKELYFEFSTKGPAFAVERLRPEGTVEAELDPAQPVFQNHGSLRIRVTRTNSLSVLVEIASVGANDVLASFAMTDPSTRAFEHTLDFAGDGLHTFEVRGFRCHSVTAEKQGEAVVLGPYSFVVDTTPPRLRVEGPEAPLLTEANWSPPEVVLHVDDPKLPGTDIETPVRVSWTIAREGSIVHSDGGVDLRPSDPLVLPLGDVAALARRTLQGGTLDGLYQVVISGRDHADNPASEASFTWSVASDGPRIDPPRKPALNDDWVQSPTSTVREWEVEVGVTDPNGVARVACTIHDRGDELEPLGVELAESRPGTFAGTLVFPTAWSLLDVELRFEAEDRTGRRSSLSGQYRKLDVVQERFAPKVAIARADKPEIDLTPMCFVPGNRSAPYVVGGRSDDSENKLFRERFGREYAYHDKSTTKSWSLAFEKGRLKDFYLDEHEVSAGQYLQFLDAGDGYRDPANWRALARPDKDRRDALRARLAALAADLPVAGVDFDEALAYAHWVGKELMSFVQWEWAVRGADYRVYPSETEGQRGIPDVADVNYAGLATRTYRGKPGFEPWRRGRGTDETQDTGIWNLGSNVAEWTRTPVYFVHGDEPAPDEDPVRHAEAHAADFLDPGPEWLDCPRYRIAGPSFESPRFDFFVDNTASRSDRRLSSVGFRCALRAAAVQEWLRPESTGPFRAREIERAGGR